MHILGSRHLGTPERRSECPPSDWVSTGLAQGANLRWQARGPTGLTLFSAGATFQGPVLTLLVSPSPAAAPPGGENGRYSRQSHPEGRRARTLRRVELEWGEHMVCGLR